MWRDEKIDHVRSCTKETSSAHNRVFIALGFSFNGSRTRNRPRQWFTRNAGSFRNISRRGEFRNAVKFKASRFTEESRNEEFSLGVGADFHSRWHRVALRNPALDSWILLLFPSSSTTFFCIIYRQFNYEASLLRIKRYRALEIIIRIIFSAKFCWLYRSNVFKSWKKRTSMWDWSPTVETVTKWPRLINTVNRSRGGDQLGVSAWHQSLSPAKFHHNRGMTYGSMT